MAATFDSTINRDCKAAGFGSVLESCSFNCCDPLQFCQKRSTASSHQAKCSRRHEVSCGLYQGTSVLSDNSHALVYLRAFGVYGAGCVARDVLYQDHKGGNPGMETQLKKN